MKKQLRCIVVFLRKRQHSKGISGRTGKLTFAVVVDDLLEIYVRRAALAEQTVAFAQPKIGVRSPSAARIIVQISLIFGDGQVVHLAGEKGIGVLKLAFIRWLLRIRWSLLHCPHGI